MSRESRTARRRHHDEEIARVTREVASRAVKRLDILEWVILLVAAALSTGAGALVAVLLVRPLGVSFRPTWIVASLLIFGVPGWLAIRKARREDDELRNRLLKEIGEPDV